MKVGKYNFFISAIFTNIFYKHLFMNQKNNTKDDEFNAQK